MRKNHSPWLHQLNKERKSERLRRDISVDVAIVGAGIAGVSTAFFTLKYTDKKVALLERHLLAHGATGHNGGQAVTYFEKGFAAMCEEFGITLAATGQRSIENTWELLDEIYTDANLDIFFARFVGHMGLASYAQVLDDLKNNHFRKQAGLRPDMLRISASASYVHDIPHEYAGLYSVVPQAMMYQLLETKSPEYQAVLSEQKGVLNSALFCEKVVEYLLQKYPDRFRLYEHASVDKLVLRHDQALLDVGTHTAKAERVVLCTNGFENMRIFNETGLDIDAKFHHLVRGTVGFMSGYLERLNKQPTALSYYGEGDRGPEANYIYLTRRPYEYEKGTHHNLVSVGGPESALEEDTSYSFDSDYPDSAAEAIDEFTKRVYDPDPNRKMEHVFTWHGLMGYTRNRIRMVGEEPQNPVLLYNLGCNGVGLLPSIFGGRKIARHLAGETVPKSIFDIPKRY
ncbi:FAD-binding oxidoreductase [Candidatus Nomurabacteria bacterium]|nr:FAD-binding oxidoreductase [Candidatus Nomurabacteria bacterium]